MISKLRSRKLWIAQKPQTLKKSKKLNQDCSLWFYRWWVIECFHDLKNLQARFKQREKVDLAGFSISLIVLKVCKPFWWTSPCPCLKASIVYLKTCNPWPKFSCSPFPFLLCNTCIGAQNNMSTGHELWGLYISHRRLQWATSTTNEMFLGWKFIFLNCVIKLKLINVVLNDAKPLHILAFSCCRFLHNSCWCGQEMTYNLQVLWNARMRRDLFTVSTYLFARCRICLVLFVPNAFRMKGSQHYATLGLCAFANIYGPCAWPIPMKAEQAHIRQSLNIRFQIDMSSFILLRRDTHTHTQEHTHLRGEWSLFSPWTVFERIYYFQSRVLLITERREKYFPSSLFFFFFPLAIFYSLQTNSVGGSELLFLQTSSLWWRLLLQSAASGSHT